MNAAQAKKISIYDLLSNLGHSPSETRKNGSEVWYKSPFRTESEPSFKIRLDQNVWYDFGEGEGGNILDFVMKFNSCGLSDALSFLDSTPLKPSVISVFANEDKKQPSLDFFNIESPLINSVKPVFHYALKNYLRERGISPEVGFKHLQEINYKVGDKEYFALGFANVSGGWEVRNPFFKGCLGKKDISLIETGSNKVSAFEGFFDFLSFLSIAELNSIGTDILILNSTSMKGRGTEVLKDKNYIQVDTYFDNDIGGKTTLNFFKEELQGMEINTRNHLYEPYKDFNEFLVKQSLQHNK
ncbi:toprim domain-containing protein [soil metagenome]